MVERLLGAPDGLTRPELARALELTVPAIAGLLTGNGESLSAIVDSTVGLHADRASSGGPVPKVIRLKPRLGYVIGVDLSHTVVRVAVADLYGRYDVERDVRTMEWDVENDLHGAFACATAAAYELADERDIAPEEITAIGLAIAAPVNASSDAHPMERTGRLRVDLGGSSSPWSNIDPLAAITNHLRALPDGDHWSAVPLHIDNDSNLGALAELRVGAARGKRNAIYVHVDEAGVGVGLVFGGDVYRGSGGIAGEFGHVVLEPRGEQMCHRCGRPCVEAAVLSLLGCGTGPRRQPLEQLVDAALDGDARSRESIVAAAEYLGRALAGFVTLLNVDRILVGGPFPPQAYSLVIPPMQAELARLIITPAAKDYVLQLGALGRQATLDGAVWLALERTRVDYLLGYAFRGGPPRAAARDSSPADIPAGMPG